MTTDVTYEQVSGSLGSILLLWAAIERQARKEVAGLQNGCLPKSAHGIAAVLNAWETAVVAAASIGSLHALLASTLRAQLQEPLSVRNGVCHGLNGVSSAYDGKPAALMWEIDGVKRSIAWDELQAAFSWLSKVPLAISMISNSPTEKLGSRIIDSAENREWWLAEYGIRLSPLTEREKG
jgi:hypothetical protein